ncbi:hypothetical protein D3C80_1432720 [compost metagenome]
MATPQQLRLDRRGDAGVLDALAITGLRARLGRVLGLDHDLVVHRRDATDAEGNLLGQLLVDLFLDRAGQRGLAVLHRHLEVEGAQVGVQGIGGPDLGFLAGIGDLLGRRGGGAHPAHGTQRQGDAGGQDELAGRCEHVVSPVKEPLPVAGPDGARPA